MPILPPDKRVFGDDSAGQGARTRTRMRGRSPAGEQDTTEVICTTCVQNVPNNQTLMTDRGPTCQECLDRMEPPSMQAGIPNVWIGISLGVAAVAIIGLVSLGALLLS